MSTRQHSIWTQRLSERPRSRRWTCILAVAGLILSCEVHVQEAIAGYATIPLLACAGIMTGGMVDRWRSEQPARGIIFGALGDFLGTILALAALAMTIGFVVGIRHFFAPTPDPNSRNVVTDDPWRNHKVASPVVKPLDLSHELELLKRRSEGPGPSTELLTIATSRFPPKGGVNEEYRGNGVYLVRVDDKVFALPTICPQCKDATKPVNWLDSEGKFKCPTCGSGFRIDGSVFEGPALAKPQSLNHLGISSSHDTTVLVHRRLSFARELDEWDSPYSFVVVSSGRSNAPALTDGAPSNVEYELRIDAVRLRAFGLSLTSIMTALGEKGFTTVRVQIGKSEEVRLHAADAYRRSFRRERIENILLQIKDGNAVYLRDVAVVGEVGRQNGDAANTGKLGY